MTKFLNTMRAAVITAVVALTTKTASAVMVINPNLPGQTSAPSDIGGWVNSFYGFALMIGGILAFGAIVYGGVKYVLAAANPSQAQDAKGWITQALLGLILLLGAYVILNVINPNLTTLSLPTLEKPGAQAAQTQNVTNQNNAFSNH